MNKRKIKSINGSMLYRAIVAGIRKVVAHQDYLNKINVFPVPDGDTGTNLVFTLQPIAELSEDKIEKMKSCGITIANSPAEIGKTLYDKLAR